MNAIRYLPKRHPDELLYSIVARYHNDFRRIDIRRTSEELFGVRVVSAVYDLPGYLGHFSEGLKAAQFKFSVKDIIHDYTLFNLYKDFVPEELANRVYKLMGDGNGGKIHSLLGVCNSGVHTLKYFTFCPECNEASLEEYGDVYFNRIHQNYGVKICPVHMCQLRDSKIPVKNNTHPGKYSLPDLKLMPTLTALKRYASHEAVALYEIAIAHQEIIHGNLPFNYRQLKEKYIGLIQKNGLTRRVDQVDLKLLRDEFIAFYGKKLLKELGSEIPDSNDSWLYSLIRQKGRKVHPLRHIMLMIFLSGSFKKFCEDASGIYDEVNFAEQKTVAKPKARYRKYYREWLELLSNHPDKSRTELRKFHYNAYKWLLKHDRYWLYQNMPPKRRHAVNNAVDWFERDSILLVKVKAAVKDLLGETQPFIKITVKSIGDQCRAYRTLIHGKDKLPSTYRYLNSITESTREFKIRKIKTVLDSYKPAKISLDEIYELSQIHRYSDKYIDEYIANVLTINTDGVLYGYSS